MNNHTTVKNFPKSQHYAVIVYGPLGLDEYISFNNDVECLQWCRDFKEKYDKYDTKEYEYVVISAQPKVLPKDYKMG